MRLYCYDDKGRCADQDEEFPFCKYPYNDGYAPCEIEDQERETEDYDG